MKPRLSLSRVWIALTAIILLAGVTGRLPAAQAKEPSSQQIASAMQSTMKIWTLNAQLKAIAICSSTVIDPAGYILTNFHCLGIPTRSQEEGTPGTFYNPQGVVALGPTLDARKAPKPTYFAKFVAGNFDLDIAVLKIVSMITTGQALPNPLPIVPIKRADSDKIQIGDYVGAIGYPFVGGDTITFTDGKISGFDDRNDDGEMDSFKVTANINGGNSGGLAIDENGNQIGIPAYGQVDADRAAKLDRILMINIAEPYIQKALTVRGVTGTDIKPAPAQPTPAAKQPTPAVKQPTPAVKQPTPATKQPTPAPSKPVFSSIRFGTGIQGGKLAGAAASFPANTPELYALFDYAGMRQGADWGYVWEIEGDEVAGAARGKVWDSSANGSYQLSLNNSGDALPSGTYQLTLYINGAAVVQASTSIGQSTPPKPQTPVPAADAGVVLKGQVLDASTKRGVADAMVVILKPNVTREQFDTAFAANDLNSVALIAASTDKNGNYQFAQGLPRGYSYSVLIAAKNYQERFFYNGLAIANDDPNVVTMSPVSLQKR